MIDDSSLLYCLYTQPLNDILDQDGMTGEIYADDSRLCIAFKPKCTVSISDTCNTINISTWMKANILKLNSKKTEILVITEPKYKSHQIPSMIICGSNIQVSECVHDFGVLFDSTLKMETHIRSVCKKAYYQIHLVHKVRPYISEDAAGTMIQASVTSLLDFCNGLLTGLSKHLIDLLQRVQNCAARVIKEAPKFAHITAILKDLHWLPIASRIEYKVLILVFKALKGLAPSYIVSLIQPYQPVRSLQSQNENLLAPTDNF